MPINIFLPKIGIIKLSSFGASKLLGENETTRSTCGNPLHIAPEIWSGTPYTNKCNIWPLGIVIYELYFLSVPFTGSFSEVRKKVIRELH
jgi:serine/threonine protein kinase